MRLDLPLVAAAFLGAQVAVVALVAVAVQKIGSHILTEPWLWAIGFAAFAATLAGVGFPALGGGAAQSGDPATLLALFVAGLKGGLLTFGGAYTAIPFVRDDVVGRGWLSDSQFLDGLALSGMMPAPLVIFVTFAGYLAGGVGGALAITAGMFLPAFSFGLLFYDRLEAVVENERFHRVLEGIAAAVVGIIAATALELARSLADRLPSLAWGLVLLVASMAALLFLRSRTTALWLIPASALAGALLFQ